MSLDQSTNPHWWSVDAEMLEEVALLTRLMTEATHRCEPLERNEIDRVLEIETAATRHLSEGF